MSKTTKQKVKKFTGVYEYLSETNKVKSKPDRCFYIRFKDQYNEDKWEKIGWLSEGYSAQLAHKIRQERVTSVRHGNMPENQKNLTFGDIWKEYDKWLDQGRKQPHDDRQRYRDYIKPFLENTPVNNISPVQLEEIKNKLFQRNLAPATVKHCLVIVRQVINKAIIWGYWNGVNPVQKIKMPQVENKRERFLTKQEARDLIEELGKRSEQTQNMAIVSLETGLRAGEIFSMRWHDINYNARIINIRGKGGVDRQVYITDQVLSVLENQSLKTKVYVFESRVGGPVKEVSDSFDRAVQKLGLNQGATDRKQTISFHTLRHTFASWLAMEGTPLLTIKELMGHKSFEMTMRYSHLCPDHKQDAVSKISGSWSD